MPHAPMESASVGALSLDSLYGPVVQSFAHDVRAQLKVSAWLLAVGLGLGALAAPFLPRGGSSRRFGVERPNDAGAP